MPILRSTLEAIFRSNSGIRQRIPTRAWQYFYSNLYWRRHYSLSRESRRLCVWCGEPGNARRQFYRIGRESDWVAIHEDCFAETGTPISTVNILLGADPELCLMEGLTAIRAREVGLDSTHTQLGCDGAGTPVELRPSPGTPEQVTQNIRNLLQRLAQHLQARGSLARVEAGSGTHYPIGGHIHFSGVEATPPLLEALDDCITIPLNMASLPSAVQQRQSNGYGRPSSWRVQPHGWEYRAPSSWLVSPTITRGVLSVAWVLAYMQRPYPSSLSELCARTDLGSEREHILALREDLVNRQIRGAYLEDDDVLTAWGLRQQAVATVSSVPTMVTIPLSGSFDYAVRDIIEGMSSTIHINVYGAAQRREHAGLPREVWVSDQLYQHMLTQAEGRDLPTWLFRWPEPSAGYTIYLSYSLRQDTFRARGVLAEVLQLIDGRERTI